MLYDSSVGYLAGVCRRYVADDDDVKDLLQNAYIKIFKQIGKFEYRGEGSLRAWMTRIVVNDSLKFLKPKRKFFPLGPVDEDRIDGVLLEDPGPDALSGIPLEELLKMIRSLPPGYRTVFNLFVFEEKSHKEIASILGIKENSSASQLFHAKAMLARLVNEYNKLHGDG